MKTSIKIDSELSKTISIVAIFTERKKEDLIHELLSTGVKPYLKEINSHRFTT